MDETTLRNIKKWTLISKLLVFGGVVVVVIGSWVLHDQVFFRATTLILGVAMWLLGTDIKGNVQIWEHIVKLETRVNEIQARLTPSDE